MKSKQKMSSQLQFPELPYAGTSGFSGSKTSEDRARQQDKNGQTGKNQKAVLMLAWMQSDQGITWKDVSRELNLHHGSASGVLSVLHKTGHLVRLNLTRTRCKVYVLPEYINGRAIEDFGRKKCCPHCGGNL